MHCCCCRTILHLIIRGDGFGLLFIAFIVCSVGSNRSPPLSPVELTYDCCHPALWYPAKKRIHLTVCCCTCVSPASIPTSTCVLACVHMRLFVVPAAVRLHKHTISSRNSSRNTRIVLLAQFTTCGSFNRLGNTSLLTLSAAQTFGRGEARMGRGEEAAEECAEGDAGRRMVNTLAGERCEVVEGGVGGGTIG